MARGYDSRTLHDDGRQPASAAQEPDGCKIALVVDGKGPIRKAIVQVLRQGGYRVLEASGVLDAQRLAEAHPNIGLLLADFATPESSGLKLARWFHFRSPETKILITTDSLWELLCQTGEHEYFGILVKPFSGAELRRMVQCVTADV